MLSIVSYFLYYIYYLKVYDGANDSAPLLVRGCGQNKNLTLLSTGNEMFVRFESDNNDERSGFLANYITISPGKNISYSHTL